ncbi:DUF2961 domain-containing protein [Parabacteroides sp. AGMB00274]|uniref:DUF2961 domain-containing protein n=1 Tax=Parabacteroides faecalis TaxID=2924040 RepID=A0ABT0C5W1_9BACT|nr:glycoside hydrolase family 172 protein [Parabacteroides faecalis]MCJ2382330.1 DUF2961 domain-containing protein [Parabacteroides faecalis]
MKNQFCLFVIAALINLCSIHAQEQVSMQSLLRKMVDRKQLVEYPESIPYKAMQASSYNRASVSPDQPGWFADSDGVFCIRTEKNREGETEWVLMEDKGPGVITKIWAVCFYYGLDDTTGANLKIYLDGEEEPTINCNFFEFVKGESFVKPPFAMETRRAGNSYLPIPYAKSCKVTMDKKVFYNIISYRSYPQGTSVRTFSMDEYNQSQILIDSVGYVLERGVYGDLASTKNTEAYSFHKTLRPQEKETLLIRKKQKAIEQLVFQLDAEDFDQALRSTVLKISFDGEQTVWTPLGDFFNIGVGLKTYQMWERAVQEDGTMICRWIMPYQHIAELEIENMGKQDIQMSVTAKVMPYTWNDRSMYFHSSWRMDDPTPGFPLFDYNLVNVKGKGIYVGDQFTVLNPEEGWWGEGDEKVYVDDDTFPSLFGTGTEDYYGWAGGVVPNPEDEFYTPFLSNVRVAAPNSMGYNTCTRTRVLDAIPFNRQLDFNIESSGSNRTSWFHLQYAVNTYWYAKPGASCNRKPLPEMASRKIMTLQELQVYNEKCKTDRYIYPGAIEAENLETYQSGDAVRPVEKMDVWGELSNGEAKCYQFTLNSATL